jgi:transcriptional antiterminator RfaH
VPLLPPEPNVCPQDLFDRPQEELAAGEGRRWRVLHTKPRQEKSLARQLHRSGVPFYLPLVARRLLVRGRVQSSYLPLFPGYLFLLGDAQERVAALATSRVVRTLEVPHQAGLWHDLRQVSRLIASGAPVTPEARLVPGDLVEIRSGVLAGLTGKVLRVASKTRFVVQVNFIQQGASVELEDFHLVALSGVGKVG